MTQSHKLMTLIVTFGLIFLCFSSGILTPLANAKDLNLPIGSMVSAGNVSFEARENLWRTVENSQFPILKGTKIKTDKGSSLVSLKNDAKFEIPQESLIAFVDPNLVQVIKGSFRYRFPAKMPMVLSAGNLSVMSTRSAEVPTNGSYRFRDCGRNEEVRGAIAIHADKSITVTSEVGNLTIFDMDRQVFVHLPSRESTTIPFANVYRRDKGTVIPVGRRSTLSSGRNSNERLEEIEQYLRDFADTLKDTKMSKDLDAKKFFSILDRLHSDKEAIKKVQAYPVRAKEKDESYTLIFCDKDKEYVIIKDFGKTIDVIDDPYWREDEAECCSSGVIIAGAFFPSSTMVFTQSLIVPALIAGSEDDNPFCP